MPKNGDHFLPHLAKVEEQASCERLESIITLKANALDFDRAVAKKRYHASSYHEPNGHLPDEAGLERAMQAEADNSGYNFAVHQQPQVPDAWTCPVTGKVMWREERHEHLRTLPQYRFTWLEGFSELKKKFKRVHIERRALHVHRLGLCTFIEAICALIDTTGDETEASSRLRNEQFRWEMNLAAQVIVPEITEWLNTPRVNKKWASKLLQKGVLDV